MHRIFSHIRCAIKVPKTFIPEPLSCKKPSKNFVTTVPQASDYRSITKSENIDIVNPPYNFMNNQEKIRILRPHKPQELNLNQIGERYYVQSANPPLY